MQLFLILLMICLVGGFVVTSLIWILFWATGILECPKQLRAILRPSPQQHVESSVPVHLYARVDMQMGRSNPGLSHIESSPFGERAALATHPILTESSRPQNTGPYVATHY
jgi:hypothetical protein